MKVAALGLVLLALAAPARAQSTNASVSGRVTDPSKAVVADARIAAIRTDTNVRQEATTNGSGDYTLANLPPGPYRIEVEKTGFKKQIRSGVTLHVQDALTLDVELTVGAVSETVSVEGGEPLVNARSGTVATTVDRTFVANLPLNGRSFQSLIYMTPGVVTTAATPASPGQFSVNGQRSDANYFMVDGVSANVAVQVGTALGVQATGAAPALSAQGGTNSFVSVDALQEFKIQTSTYAPEFGRTPGGQISIVTRSGTNHYHGSLFEYFRNDELDSADYFVKRQGLSKPEESQHDFGGVFGGPIERDRMFVFVSYEGLRLDQPRSAVTEVPSLASRGSASDAVLPILAAYPLPNGPETTNGLAQFSASYSDPSTLDATSVRVDRTFGTSLSLFGRYNYAPSDASSRLGSFGNASANTVGTLQNSLQTLTVGTTWIASRTISNELRVNWSRNVGTNFHTLDSFGGAVVPPATTLHPAFLPEQSNYQVFLGGTNTFFFDGLNASNTQRQLNIVDAVQLTKAGHQLKFGIDYRRLFPIYGPLQYNQAYFFNGATGLLAGTAASLSTIGFSTSNRFPHATNFSTYAQDTWQASSRLTLAYGLRWDINPPPRIDGNTDALTLATADQTALALAPAGTPMYRTTYGNVAPRIGATYRVREASVGETVVRGGWGAFYDLGVGPAIDDLATAYPFVVRRTQLNVPFPTSPALLTPPTATPGAVVDFLTVADPHLQLPYTHQWNVAVERAVGAASMVSLSYVGAAGRRLIREERLISPTPQFGQLTLITNNGHSRYNSLQVKYTRRLSQGVCKRSCPTRSRSRWTTRPVMCFQRCRPCG